MEKQIGKEAEQVEERKLVAEQERIAKEKKRKKNRKKLAVAGVVVTVLLLSGLWYVVWGRGIFSKQQATIIKIEASAGQEIVYAQLTSVKGNEITYTVAEKTEGGVTDTGMPNGRNSVEGEKSERPGMPEGGEMPEMGQMPEGGEMPEMGQMPEGGEMPEMGQFPEMAGGRGQKGQSGMQDGGQNGMPGNMSDATAFTYDGTTYRLTEESVTTMIPVGTEVITKLGTITTFSRLAAGDNVALVVEESGEAVVIVAVYIIG